MSHTFSDFGRRMPSSLLISTMTGKATHHVVMASRFADNVYMRLGSKYVFRASPPLRRMKVRYLLAVEPKSDLKHTILSTAVNVVR